MEITYEWFKEQISDKKALKWFMKHFPEGVADYQKALEKAEEVYLEEWFIEKLGSHNIYDLHEKAIDAKKLIRAGSVFCDGPMHVDSETLIAGNLEVNGCIYVGSCFKVFGNIICNSDCIMDAYLLCNGSIIVKGKLNVNHVFHCAKNVKAKEIFTDSGIQVGGNLEVKERVRAGNSINVGGDFKCPEISMKAEIMVGGQLNSKRIIPVSWDDEMT
jgi:cytoskeletal protein CcmA (bactofilin family)